MKGHDKIIAARFAGKIPSFVFVNDYPCKTYFSPKGHATVCTAHDSITNLDFRFLIGLCVSISAMTEDRAKALFEKAKVAGAKVVGAVHVQIENNYLDQTGWCAVAHKSTGYFAITTGENNG